MATVKKGFIAEGTTCESCSEIIRRQARKVDGVASAHFDYATETGHVTFDDEKTDIDAILSKIEEKGYKCFILDDSSPAAKKGGSWLGLAFLLIGLAIGGFFILRLTHGIEIPSLTKELSLPMLFAVGLLTGFHCVGMCGGFVLSYTAKDAQAGRSSHLSHILYGSGKVLSYTVIGALFGLLGSVIAFTPMLRGAIGILAGIFLVIFGLKMLNVIPALRRFRLPMPKAVSRMAADGSNPNNGPFIIGLMNGLMIACGPLQAMYILAAGTGSAIEGAKMLLAFGLGTLPVLLGFGYVASFISSKWTSKILKASGVLIIVLGFLMLNNGLALTGTGYDFKSLVSKTSTQSQLTNAFASPGPQQAAADLPGNVAVLKDGYQEIRMDVLASGWSPDTFVLRKGVPVKWIINGKEITSCNRAIQVPKYNLQFDIKPGEQEIDFTPTESGTVPWSCWMGMIQGTFIVRDAAEISTKSASEIISSAPRAQASGGTCGGSSGGGCGCGMMKKQVA